MGEPEASQSQGLRYTPGKYSPAYHIPSTPIIGIEHPCIIKNKDKSIQSLGGLLQLQKVNKNPSHDPHQQHTKSVSTDIQKLVNHTTDVIKLNLKPGNRESSLIKSIKVLTSDLAVKVTVPKRTGLKRKRGSDGPFWTPNGSPASRPDGSHSSSSVGSQAKRFLRSLQDNEKQYQIEVVGQVVHTYRFRGLASLLVICCDRC